MTETDRRNVTEERLGYYRHRMREGNATPLICIGVGHDHTAGQAVVCLPDGVPTATVYGFVSQLKDLLERAMAEGK